MKFMQKNLMRFRWCQKRNKYIFFLILERVYLNSILTWRKHPFQCSYRMSVQINFVGLYKIYKFIRTNALNLITLLYENRVKYFLRNILSTHLAEDRPIDKSCTPFSIWKFRNIFLFYAIREHSNSVIEFILSFVFSHFNHHWSLFYIIVLKFTIF